MGCSNRWAAECMVRISKDPSCTLRAKLTIKLNFASTFCKTLAPTKVSAASLTARLNLEKSSRCSNRTPINQDLIKIMANVPSRITARVATQTSQSKFPSRLTICPNTPTTTTVVNSRTTSNSSNSSSFPATKTTCYPNSRTFLWVIACKCSNNHQQATSCKTIRLILLLAVSC